MTLASQILQYILSGINIGSIYGLVAIGFNIIYNTTGIINLAQGEFVMLGGMIMVSLHVGAHIPMLPAFFLTVILVAAVGGLFERLAIHPLKNPTVLILIIITVAGSILMKGIAMFIWGKETFQLPHFSGEEPILFFGASLLPQTLWILGITAGIVLLLGLFFRYTLTGKAMRACAANRTAAQLVGIDVRKMVFLSFALSAAIGAAAGIVITPIALMDYDRGAMLALKGFGAAVLGGLGNSGGAVVAGFMIGILECLGAGFISSGYKDAIALFVLLIVLFVRPSGIFGSAETARLKDF
ncbi:MAG TPA: branched-chain amino acid ABC transporter permease [bacterium]|nr:branched-chain amino acid ABC transporter permease [bacterium]HPO09639.1 branched-chain amino acid ABC transporter permease [bacterium]HQO35169.1 branched-chain amino acid ABC transporter permease [bacterium]HQP98430.1 branched-chain amino acid ABC transporter permease [bacterium]